MSFKAFFIVFHCYLEETHLDSSKQHLRQKQHKSRKCFFSKYFLFNFLCNRCISFKVFCASLFMSVVSSSIITHLANLSSKFVCFVAWWFYGVPEGGESQNKHAQLAKSSDCISQFSVKTSTFVRVHSPASLSVFSMQHRSHPGKDSPGWKAHLSLAAEPLKLRAGCCLRAALTCTSCQKF